MSDLLAFYIKSRHTKSEIALDKVVLIVIIILLIMTSMNFYEFPAKSSLRAKNGGDIIESQVPSGNVKVYCLLYCIENALRELIIDKLKTLEGPRWYKKCLPGDILKKYEDGFRYEKNIKWTQLIPHHPIYYIDFTDLKKIIERNDNWDNAFKHIFTRKDILSNTLSEIEYIRNKIAHNRKVSGADATLIESAYTKLSNAIGEDYFNKLTGRCTTATDIYERLIQLQEEAKNAYMSCKNCELLKKLEIWPLVDNEWWFDESYLQNKINFIQDFFKTVMEYCDLPRKRGTGHNIEAWVKSKNIDTKYQNANNEFCKILDNGQKDL